MVFRAELQVMKIKAKLQFVSLVELTCSNSYCLPDTMLRVVHASSQPTTQYLLFINRIQFSFKQVEKN